MGKNSKNGGCKSSSHHLYKDRAKNRVEDLHGMFTDLQSARKESRTIDVAVLEEQVHQMLREWKAELNEPSPACSLQQEGSLGSFSTDIYRLLHLCEEEDDATSALAAPKPEPDNHKVGFGNGSMFQEVGFPMNHGSRQQEFQLGPQCKSFPSGVQNIGVNNLDFAAQLDYQTYELHQDDNPKYFSFDDMALYREDTPACHIPGFFQNICLPPSAFLGPKCALWDCPRPAQECQVYCSTFHAALALNEGPPGMTPVLRPGGIGLKDGLLFAALTAKAQGKDVGVPECEGAATTKSPWNAPELFDLTVLEGETIREWLFFDKPRRAFESGNRKQRSLPDYNGRGWHESRKQIMNEYGGLKRSYYMDPQPRKDFEWHLYEYEINKCDVCALYRLEFKQVDGKKTTKSKVTTTDSVVDLQKQLGRLTAEFPNRKGGGKMKTNLKKVVGAGNIYNTTTPSRRVMPADEGFEYATTTRTTGTGPPPYNNNNNNSLVDNLNGYYI
ncbi:transcription factor VOZ1-like isoform X2 [Impatiens glandulifera]|uniref:transcription factor VOZ1-like isoform X2 n=1 Tax=Impatiens glandulifera TaxID=253017 RepID=UPI001FB157C7|nr:transcription factor VOZ1-like isoform X2 [Impatiens glandulifera]